MNLPISPVSNKPSRPHTCTCRSKVAENPQNGVVLWSDSEVVMAKLAAAFGKSVQQAFRVEGAEWPSRCRELAATLSPIEQQAVRAAGLDEAGNSNPWHAVPLATMLERLASAWLPGVLNTNAMVSFMQPIVRLDTGSTIGFEALARARFEGKLLNGGQLIDAARAHGALFQFDQQTRVNAIRQCASKLQGGESLFINFIPMAIYDPAVCLRSCWEAAQDTGVILSQLVFEVVESEQFPDLKHLRTVLDAYREQGARVALDDLGTGHTALSYIEELRPDYIKLAKGLIPDDVRDADLPLVGGLVEHARRLGVTSLVEGIEKPAQADAARALGIELAQGWLYGKPSEQPVRTMPFDASARLAA